MERAGLNGSEVARRLGWSQSRISRLLNGKRGGTESDVVAVTAVCGIVGPTRDQLVAASREANSYSWLSRVGAVLPKKHTALIDHENDAARVSLYDSVIVPSLLQTPDYSRALLRAKTCPEMEVEEQVREIGVRQRILESPKVFTFYLHEFALRMPVGGRLVMSDQLHHLLRLSVLPPVTIRIVPAVLDGPTVFAAPFQLLEFDGGRPVVHIDGETVGLFLEERSETAVYQRTLAVIAEAALNDEQSRRLIAWTATKLCKSEEHEGFL